MPKTRKMLSDMDAPYIRSLSELMQSQNKTTLASWSIDYAQRYILPLWEKRCPEDMRPAKALDSAREWLSGRKKLPLVKKDILECHAAASEMKDDPASQAAARAIGQCASTVHSARHCLGLALYGTVALAYDRLGCKVPWEQIKDHAAEECGRMEASLRKVAKD